MDENKLPDPDAIKMFVGQLPHSYGEKEIREVFEVYGPVYEVVIHRDKLTWESNGCCFVTFFHRADTLTAFDALHDKKKLEGRTHPIQIQLSKESWNVKRELFIGKISKKMKNEDLEAMFSPFGKIEKCFVLKEVGGASKGCGFVTFAFPSSAQKAVNALHLSQTMEGCPSPMVVAFAQASMGKEPIPLISRTVLSPATVNQLLQQSNLLGLLQNPLGQTGVGQPNGLSLLAGASALNQQLFIPSMGMNSIHQVPGVVPSPFGVHFAGGSAAPAAAAALAATGGSQIRSLTGLDDCNLFVYNIPRYFTHSDLHSFFLPFGNVVSANVFTDYKTGRSRGYGFVSYDNPESAAAAISAMNGYEVAGKRLQVTLKANDARASAHPYHR